jgi:hypothetical protein
MYTYNILCFGHELASNKELNNFLMMYDVEFFDVIKGNEWQVSFPYHGGQVKGDTHSCVFGNIITDDDDNPYYLQEVRGLKEEDYLPDYQIFLDKLFAECQDDIEHMNTNFNKSLEEIEYREAYIQLIGELKQFIKKNKPKFYTVEASS